MGNGASALSFHQLNVSFIHSWNLMTSGKNQVCYLKPLSMILSLKLQCQLLLSKSRCPKIKSIKKFWKASMTSYLRAIVNLQLRDIKIKLSQSKEYTATDWSEFFCFYQGSSWHQTLLMIESWYAWLLLQWKKFLSSRRKKCIGIYV